MAFNPTKTRTWKDGTTPQTGTLALGSLFNAEFDQLYENDNYLKTNLDALTTIVTDPSLKKKEVDDADYTILDDDGYDLIIFKNLTANRDCNCPTLSANQGRKITIINESDYDVDIIPEDRGGGDVDKINKYSDIVTINQQWGYVILNGAAGQWDTIIGPNSSVYETSTETAVDLSTTVNTWADALSLTNVPKGIYDIKLNSNQYIDRPGNYANDHYGLNGVGTVSGNTTPNIEYKFTWQIGYAGNYFDQFVLPIDWMTENYDNSTGTSETFYFKGSYGASVARTTHQFYSTTDMPTRIKMIRRA